MLFTNTKNNLIEVLPNKKATQKSVIIDIYYFSSTHDFLIGACNKSVEGVNLKSFNAKNIKSYFQKAFNDEIEEF